MGTHCTWTYKDVLRNYSKSGQFSSKGDNAKMGEPFQQLPFVWGKYCTVSVILFTCPVYMFGYRFSLFNNF